MKAGSAEFGAVGSVYGEKSHLLTIPELAPHSHNFLLPSAGSQTNLTAANGGNGNPNNVANSYASIGSTGGGLAHNNVQPSIALTPLIKT